MARKKIRQATDQRKFTIVYNDFLESKVLDYYEKLLFIAIKKYADNQTLKSFPSHKRLHELTGISIAKIRRSIEHMEELGVLSIEHRIDSQKGNQSNIYTLYDYAEIWNVSSEDECNEIADVINEAKMIAELKARGYVVSKAKESELAEQPTKVIANTDPSIQFKQYDIVNTTSNYTDSQVAEKHTLQEVRELFDYDLMIEQEPLLKEEIDCAINILYDCLNTTKKMIRVSGEEKPTLVVISKLMKLEYSEIIYCVKKFMQHNEKINNPIAYMLTLLYGAKEQMRLDIANQVNIDF